RRGEVRPILHVEALRPELGAQSFGQRRGLEERQIHLGEPRPTEAAPAYISPCAYGGHDECVRIEPLCLLPQDDGTGEIGVEGGAIRIARIAVAGPVRAGLRREGEAAEQRRDSVELPAADQLLFETCRAAE